VSRSRALLATAVALVVVAVAVAVAASQGGGAGGGPPPATGAAAIVPADALAYVHLSTDGTRPGVKRALTLAARFPDYPLLGAALASRLGALGSAGSAISFATDVRPWLGGEAALALLNTATSTADPLIVLDVADHARAQAFVSGIGASRSGAYRGVQLLLRAPSTTLAFVSHYLVIGTAAGVRAAIDVVAAGAPSLAADAAYRRAAANEPAGRLLDAYASAAGVRRLLVAQGGLLGALGVLLYQPALSGVAVSLSAAPPGAQLLIHSALDPSLARIGGSGSRSFTPSLAADLPSGSTLALDVTGLARIAPRVLDAGTTGGIAGGLGALLSRLGTALSAEGVNVAQILSIFGGETAVAIAPGATGRTPGLLIVARTPNEAATEAKLAELEVPLAQLLSAPASASGSAGGVEPAFTDRQIDGVTAHQLPVASGFELDYAVFRGLVVVSTSLDGIAAVVADKHTLANQLGFKETLAGRPPRVTSLLFLDFSQLLSLAEQTGLTRGARFAVLRADLDKVRAVGLTSTSGEADSTAELSLQIQ
jgi:hypothetical protein